MCSNVTSQKQCWLSQLEYTVWPLNILTISNILELCGVAIRCSKIDPEEGLQLRYCCQHRHIIFVYDLNWSFLVNTDGKRDCLNV